MNVRTRDYPSRWIGACGVTPYCVNSCCVLLHSYREGTVCPSCVGRHQLVGYVVPSRGRRRLVQDYLVIKLRSGIALGQYALKYSM